MDMTHTEHALPELTVIPVTWEDEESSGYTDIFPCSWFTTAEPKSGVFHEVWGPRGGVYLAQCDVSLSGLTADLNYEPYPDFNDRQDMYLGVVRLHFSSAQRTKVARVEWKAQGERRFVRCEFESPGCQPAPTLERTRSGRGAHPLTLAQIRSHIRTRFPQLRERRMKHQTSWWLDDDPLPAATLRILSVKQDGRLLKWARTALLTGDKRYHPLSGGVAALTQRIEQELAVRSGDGSTLVHVDPIPQPVQPFSGSLREAIMQADSLPAAEEAAVLDMEAAAEARRAAGRKAEDVALQKERERLCLEGRPDLAVRVALVSDRPGLGYDIRSFDRDGTDRFIEVKNISSGARFYVSIHQWVTSRKGENYWFYLVSGVGSEEPQVECFPAAALEEKHLEPVEFLVRLSSKAIVRALP
jgi:hypothetical protein